MTQMNKNFVKVSSLVIAIFISLTSVSAKDSNQSNGFHSVNALKNLRMAIQSENPGLRESGIYLSGKYSVNEVSETLLEQLKVESNPNLRILIMRVLYIFGEDQFMDNIHEVALNDDNPRVRKMATALYSAMEVEYSFNIAANGS